MQTKVLINHSGEPWNYLKRACYHPVPHRISLYVTGQIPQCTYQYGSYTIHTPDHHRFDQAALVTKRRLQKIIKLTAGLNCLIFMLVDNHMF